MRWALEGGGGKAPIEVAQRWEEFRYRRLFPALTHDQYLDEPSETVDWMLAIDGVLADLRKR